MALLIVLFGLVIGSFLNVLIVRLPAGEEVVVTRSHCVHCGAVLGWTELIPLISYAVQKGRCAHCGEKISLRYPLVEGLTAVCFLLLYLRFGWQIQTVLYMIFTACLIACAFIDGMTRRIPDVLCLAVFLTGLAGVFYFRTGWQPAIAGALSVSLPLFVLYLVTKGRAIGGGDIKLYVGCGLLLGAPKALLSFAIACILGSVIHLLRMALTHAGRELALGPYLCAGLFTVTMAGDELLQRLFP